MLRCMCCAIEAEKNLKKHQTYTRFQKKTGKKWKKLLIEQKQNKTEYKRNKIDCQHRRAWVHAEKRDSINRANTQYAIDQTRQILSIV